MWRRWAVMSGWLWAAAAAWLVLAGCGGPGYPRATVSGIVTIDGKPVPKGQITFTPTSAGQGPAVGAPIADGKYRCDKVPLGKLRVTLVAHAAQTQQIFDVANNVQREVPVDLLPGGYSQEVDIRAGHNTLDLAIQSGG